MMILRQNEDFPYARSFLMDRSLAQSNEISQSKSSGDKNKKDEELCLICGDRASGYHYNALSCEGCKGFFRRSITRSADYVCKDGGKCEMDMWMRRKCQYCRLRRCREVGMREECLLSEEQCKARMSRRKLRPRQSKDKLTDDGNRSDCSSVTTSDVTQTYVDDNPMAMLCENHHTLIERIVELQDKYELPSEESANKISALENLSGMAPQDIMFLQMSIATLQTTQLVVEFAKELPSFQDLDDNDKIAVLKGSASEVMMLRTARRYDLTTDCIIFSDNKPYPKEVLSKGGLDTFVDIMFPFCRSMAELQTDNAEYALLTAIVMFSDREQVQDMKKVEKIQEVYIDALRAYTRAKFLSQQNIRLPKLLMKLTDLRTLSDEHLKVLRKMMVAQRDIPKLLQEYFNL